MEGKDNAKAIFTLGIQVPAEDVPQLLSFLQVL